MAVSRASRSARLTALLFGAILLPSLALLGFMYFASVRSLAGEQQALVDELLKELLSEYNAGGPNALAESIQERLRFDPNSDAVMGYASPNGRLIVGNLRQWPRTALNEAVKVDLERSGGNSAVPVLLEVHNLPDGSFLLAGHVTTGNESLRRANVAGLLIALLMAVPLALGLAFVMLRLIGRQAERISGVAERFGAGDLSQRVPLDGSGDAFDRLASALNAMLDRIETLVGELRLVTDGLAHDLRSPVTRLQSAVEDAAVQTRDPQPGRALENAAQEAQALQSMLSTALQISRAEAGIGRDRFEQVRLAEMLEELAEIYGPVAENEGMELTVEAPSTLTALVHRELIGQAVSNLIDNALRYAEGATHIGLSARQIAEGVEISVADNGVGIPPERQAEALRRFGRLDPSRHQSGSGLGLSLVEAAARLHRGRIELGDAGPGLTVRIILPRFSDQ